MKHLMTFDDYLKEQLKDPEFKKDYEEEGVYVDLAVQIAKLREKQGYTQKQLAKLLHTTQQTISRIENPRNGSLSVQTLIKLAKLFKKNLEIRFV